MVGLVLASFAISIVFKYSFSIFLKSAVACFCFPYNAPKIDPLTGEKRKRGRPKGSKNKTTPTTKKTTKKVKK